MAERFPYYLERRLIVGTSSQLCCACESATLEKIARLYQAVTQYLPHHKPLLKKSTCFSHLVPALFHDSMATISGLPYSQWV